MRRFLGDRLTTRPPERAVRSSCCLSSQDRPVANLFSALLRSGRVRIHPRSRKFSEAAAIELLERRELLTGLNTPVTLANIEVVKVSDSSAWGFTHYLKGSIIDETRVGVYRVEIDLNSDGSIDASGAYSAGATNFAYALGIVPGTHSLSARVVNVFNSTVAPDVTGWSGAQYTLVPPSSAPETKFVHFVEGSTPPMYAGMMKVGTVRGEVKDFTRTANQPYASSYLFQVDTNGDSIADQTQYGQPGAFSFSVTLMNGSAPKFRVIESDPAGQTYDSGWQSVEMGGTHAANVAPNAGADGWAQLGWGGLDGPIPEGPAAHPFIGNVSASDSDDPAPRLKISQARLPGFGSDGNFYLKPPKNAVELSGGELRVGDAEVLQAFYDRDFKFGFTIVADDGQSTDSAAFVLYDDWKEYLKRAEQHLAEWAGQMRALISATAQVAMSAYNDFQTFVEAETNAAPDLLQNVASHSFTAAAFAGPKAAVAAAVGDVVVTIATEAWAAKGHQGYQAFLLELQSRMDAQRQIDLDEVDYALNGTPGSPESGEYDRIIQERVRLQAEPLTLDEMARQAAFYLRKLRQRRPVPVPEVAESVLIYGQLLLAYASVTGSNIYYRYQGSYGEWASDDTLGVGWGDEIAEELNRIGYPPPEED